MSSQRVYYLFLGGLERFFNYPQFGQDRYTGTRMSGLIGYKDNFLVAAKRCLVPKNLKSGQFLSNTSVSITGGIGLSCTLASYLLPLLRRLMCSNTVSWQFVVKIQTTADSLKDLQQHILRFCLRGHSPSK